MISDGLKKIIETFRKQGTMSFLEPATEEQISAFEKENGITFPEEYREWLSFSDGGELFPASRRAVLRCRAQAAHRCQ